MADPNAPDTPSAACLRMAERRKLPRLIMGGTAAVRAAALDPAWRLPAPGSTHNTTLAGELAMPVPATAAEIREGADIGLPTPTTALLVGGSVLPQKKGEELSEYIERLFRTPLPDDFQECVFDLTGRLFRKPPNLMPDVPLEIRGQEPNEAKGLEKISGWWENVDKAGRHGDVWGWLVFADAQVDGIVVGLVDKPPGGAPGERLDQTKLANRRPYFVEVSADSLLDLSPRTTEGGDVRLGILKYEEITEEGNKSVRRIRKYLDGMAPGERANDKLPGYVPAGSLERLASYEVQVEVEVNGKKAWQVEDQGLLPLDHIPARVLNLRPYRKDPYEAEPPRLSLAESVLWKWRKQVAADNLLEIVSVAALGVIGSATHDIEAWGSFRVVVSPTPGSDIRFIEHTGAGVGSMETSIDKVQEIIDRQKRQPLLMQPGNPATATEIATGTSMANSLLEAEAMLYKDFLEGLLDEAMQWQGRPPGSGGSVQVQRDALSVIAATDFAEIREMAKEGLLDDLTVLREARRRGILAEDEKPEEVLARVKKQREEDMSFLRSADPAAGGVRPGAGSASMMPSAPMDGEGPPS